ncbi:MAG: glycosyl hydrolase [Terracidiphilus sp.]
MHSRLNIASLILIASLSCLTAVAQAPLAPSDNALMRGFQTPPNGARPRVWWHWMNGNISEDGIKLDLDWMHRVGLGGVTIFEGAINTPQVVPHRLIYMTPDWKHAFDYAVTTARSKGMEVAIASSPGWSETGGPWVPAAQGMKKLVWSKTRVEGGKPFVVALPHPPQVDGTFQDFKIAGRRGPNGRVISPPEFYADVAVIAYRIPDGDESQAQLAPHVTASGGAVNVPALSDGDVEDAAVTLPAGTVGGESWVEFDYGHPQTIQAVTMACPEDIISVFDHKSNAIPPRLEASDDGIHFRKVADIPFSSLVESTASFDAVTARYFRVVITTNAEARAPRGHKITELVLSSGARTNEFEKRAGFATARDYWAIADPRVAPQYIVSPSDVIDLTGKMKTDGTLDWTPPPGKWMVLRMGYSLTGHQNQPAPPEATGLEVDKLNRQDVKHYLDHYLSMYANTVGPSMMGKDGISYLLTDSFEVGPQNWTDDMLADFERLRGYDARPWLPALTGVIVKSTYDTDRFLWDFRRTIGELLAENHYGEIASDLHAHGMKYYSEALEYHRPSLGDDMEMRSHADVPMGAMWTYLPDTGPDLDYFADLRGAASVAHIYGQNLVGGESMTSRGPAWSWSPKTLKKITDLEFALGVNRFEIHESTHQPVPDMAPGLTLGPYGLWFNRNQTWADEAKPWVTYLSRCSYLLQQGHFYADVAYFYGQEGPLTAVFGWKAIEDAPEGYDFDFVNSDVLLHEMTFKGGRLVTPGGTSYRIVYLGGRSNRMTLAVLHQLVSFVKQGAVIVGEKPSDSPSLADNEAEFRRLANELWGKEIARGPFVHKYGKGKVYSGMSADAVLAALGEAKDFDYSGPHADTTLMFVHRKADGGDIYFVDNREDRAVSVDATFRVAGKTPELWDAAAGTSRPVSYRIADGRTTIPLHLDPYGTDFVVFLKSAVAPSLTVAKPAETPVASLNAALNSNWSVSFEPCRGAPANTEFARLGSWSDNSNVGVKYFSGTATYSKTIDIPASAFRPGAHLWLDLGNVEDIAQVAVNGRPLGIAWKTPFRIDLTGAIHPGANEFAIKVTNLWVNRLIGDQQSYALKKYAFTDFTPYKADSPLLPSGLLGPVRLVSVSGR